MDIILETIQKKLDLSKIIITLYISNYNLSLTTWK